MKLLGIESGRVLNASGARGFFGEASPYWFHCPLRLLGLDFAGSTFIAKTTTLEPRRGNMPLGGPAGTTPREWYPRCIRVNFRRGAVLNAVGLSGPGLDALLADGRWQARLDPFLISLAAVDGSPDARRAKFVAMAGRLAAARPRFRAHFGVEVNVSCPNCGVDYGEVVREARGMLGLLADRLNGIPLIPKVNALMPVDAAREIASHPACAALCVSNTIPWGVLPDRIDWRGLFGDVSPLAGYGGGGLSGAPLLPIVRDWVARATASGFPVPIVAGGGILSADDAASLLAAGAAAVELGSIAILRPWRVAGIVRSINQEMQWSSLSDARTISTSTFVRES